MAMNHNDDHSGSRNADISTISLVTRRQVLIAGSVSIVSLCGQATGDAASVEAETRKGRRRKRERRRLSRPGGAFRTSQVKVANLTGQSLKVSFYYLPEEGTGYGPPTTDGKTYTVFPNSAEPYAPGQFRIGVLVHAYDAGNDLYVDMRNVHLWYPRAGAYQGRGLDPAAGSVGDVFIAEQNYGEGEAHTRGRVVLKRGNDSTYYIEWVVEISRARH